MYQAQLRKQRCSSFVPIEETESLSASRSPGAPRRSCSSFVPIEETESALDRILQIALAAVAVRSFR